MAELDRAFGVLFRKLDFPGVSLARPVDWWRASRNRCAAYSMEEGTMAMTCRFLLIEMRAGVALAAVTVASCTSIIIGVVAAGKGQQSECHL